MIKFICGKLLTISGYCNENITFREDAIFFFAVPHLIATICVTTDIC